MHVQQHKLSYDCDAIAHQKRRFPFFREAAFAGKTNGFRFSEKPRSQGKRRFPFFRETAPQGEGAISVFPKKRRPAEFTVFTGIFRTESKRALLLLSRWQRRHSAPPRVSDCTPNLQS